MLHFHQIGKGLSRSAWWEGTGCLCLKTSEGTSRLSLEQYLTWSGQIRYKVKNFARGNKPMFFNPQKYLQAEKLKEKSQLSPKKKKNVFLSDLWISIWGHNGNRGITLPCCPQPGGQRYNIIWGSKRPSNHWSQKGSLTGKALTGTELLEES